MESINVQIDISTNTGIKLLREIQKHPKVAVIEYPKPPEIAGQKTYTMEEIEEIAFDILSKNYGIDVRKL